MSMISRVLPLFVTLLIIGELAQAQGIEALPKGRSCDQRRRGLPWPTLGQLGDSAVLMAALAASADPQKPVTYVTIRYGGDGTVTGIVSRGALPHERPMLEATFKEHVVTLEGAPNDFEINVARLNADGYVATLGATTTCPPDQRRTVESDRALRELRTRPRARNVSSVVVQLWLEATGETRALWIVRGSGDPALDSMAAGVIRAFQYLPAIVGTRAVPVLIQVPVNFH